MMTLVRQPGDGATIYSVSLSGHKIPSCGQQASLWSEVCRLSQNSRNLGNGIGIASTITLNNVTQHM
jgi:hypothetical protein